MSQTKITIGKETARTINHLLERLIADGGVKDEIRLKAVEILLKYLDKIE